MAAGAILSWRFVERPFRQKTLTVRAVGTAVAASSALLVAGGAVMVAAKGLPGRLNAAAAVMNESVGNNYRCPVSAYLKFGMSHACQMNLPSRDPADAQVVLLGNSHAQMFEPAWEAILAARGQTGLLVAVTSCLPTVSANITLQCQQAAALNLTAVIALQRAKTVIVGLTWDHPRLVDGAGRPLADADGAALTAAVDDLIDRLHQANKDVVLIGPIAEPGYEVASVVSRQLAFGHKIDRPTYTAAAVFYGRFGYVIRHFDARTDIRFARPDSIQCTGSRCEYFLDGHALFSDTNHIAANEARQFKAVFAASLPVPAISR
jgi:hypothetical protein